ncbi:MAG TPA: hypothetical protein VGK87_14980, partial [Anaerolineae bacterium]
PTSTATARLTETPVSIQPTISSPGVSPDEPKAVTAARLELARRMGITYTSASVISFTATDWPDSCLGVLIPNTACAEVITPGYRILIKANDVVYEYHTDKDGTSLILLDRVDGNSPANVRSGASNDLVLVWHREGGFAGFCDSVNVHSNGEYTISSCKSRTSVVLQTGHLDSAQTQALVAWSDKLKPFQTSHIGSIHPDELIVEITFYGTGGIEATSEDRKAIEAFGQMVRTVSK